MKKAIFTALAAGALILAGCTKVETTDIPESRIIQFTDFVTNDVKSIETANDLTMFRVFGAVGENEEDKVFDKKRFFILPTSTTITPQTRTHDG